jgi:hypothetical protein
MSQFAWSAFTADSKDRHLVVARVPADITEEPAAVVQLLIKGLAPKGDFALSSEETADGTTVFCAFALAADADMMVEAINAQERNLYPGWASEHHCLLDKTAAEAIVDAVQVSPDHPMAG